MFEISGNDILLLNDSDLRSLVARLALAELRAKGYPRSSVTAGGNQDAADGGIDVRVECPIDITNPDFVPKRHTGFQVKKPDMTSSAIMKEMCPGGKLRDVIRELADMSGSYVIVSSQGTVADKPLQDRRKAMRNALSDLPNAKDLRTDFYDRDRLATWANEYPGVAIWVQSKVGRSLAGWSNIENWNGSGDQNLKPYLSNDKNCLIEEGAYGGKSLPIIEGIKLLREKLGKPGQCIRLIGLSGLGKTRLVQALFEEGVGTDPLDSSLAVYTDYSEKTNPTARDMARELIASQQRAILIVDNCNPSTHTELARLCSCSESKVSLISVEYDVRDDVPEDTDVFRLQSSDLDLLETWIKRDFSHISDLDRRTIAKFTDGNFRVAGALAKTLVEGESRGILKSQTIFERLFYQRNEPDKQLLRAAEDLSLLYSIDGEDVSEESELSKIGAFSSVGAQMLYEKLAEMRDRGIAQARGRFRAILPHAISNRLASNALKRLPPTHFDKVCSAMSFRMLKSLSRRLGYLHDSPSAEQVVARWLNPDGPLGDLLSWCNKGVEIMINIAPAAPDLVLAKLEKELNLSENVYALERFAYLRMIKAIGYEAHLFERSVMLLTRFVPVKGMEQNNTSNRDSFKESFQIGRAHV